MPISIVGMFGLTRFIANSLVFTIPFSLASCRMMLAASPYPHGLGFTLSGSEFIVGVAPDTTVTNHACTPRLLPEERQVLLSMYGRFHKYIQNNHLHGFMSHAFNSVLEQRIDAFMRPGNLQGGFNWHISQNKARLAVMAGTAPKPPKIKAPTRVLGGRHDTIHKAEWADALSEALDNLTVAIAEQCDHFVHYEDTQLAATEIDALFSTP